MTLFARRFVLRDLSLPARMTIAAFLVCVGIGYIAALVQLHLQHASPGKLLPDAEDAANTYHGRTGISQLERLLVTDEGKPFNGSGTMRQTFTTRSAGWKGAISRRARENKISLRQAEAQLRSERDGERLALLAWIRAGANQKEFEEDGFFLPESLAKHPISDQFVEPMGDSMKVKIASIFEARCARCHSESVGGSAALFPLQTWEEVHAYCDVETRGSGISLKKLAQSTHAHLLSLTMLYGLTGLLVVFTSYPGWLRGTLALVPLVAQLVEIGCWWLGRMDPLFAQAIVFLGGAVAAGLVAQIVLTLFNLFGRNGKLVLVIVLLAGAAAGYVVKEQVIDPYLERETLSATVLD